MADNQVVKAFPIDLASGITLSSGLDLRQGWREMSLQIPSFPSATQVFIHAAKASNSTYVKVMFPSVNTSTAEINDFAIASGLGERMVPIPNGYQHLKIELKTQQTDTTSVFNVICKS